MFYLCYVAIFAVFAQPEEMVRRNSETMETWYLAMNLNPADGHSMDYTTGWIDDVFLGTYTDALTKDYLNRLVWRHPANFIAIVRHQEGLVDAVKVFRFKNSSRSLLSRFMAMDPGREVVTEGGPLQVSVSKMAQNLHDDPIFSVGGDLAFNWAYTNNDHRIVMTGGYLSPVGVNDDGTRGIGNHFYCHPHIGRSIGNSISYHEISIIAPLSDGYIQGSDHGYGAEKDGPVYGNYAIYVSEDATSFPEPGYVLGLEINVEATLKFFKNHKEL